MSPSYAGADSRVILQVREETQVGEARRLTGALARKQGFSELKTASASLIAVELATNLVKHAERGELHLSAVEDGRALELLALDRGPGIEDVTAALGDGFSSRFTAGVGLGAIVRQSDEFDIYSRLGSGTAIVARVRVEGAAPESYEFGAVQAVAPGESICGDAFLIRDTPHGLLVAMADGLGHGPGAALAACTAMEIVQSGDWEQAPSAIVREIHAGLRPTRGAAVAVAKINRAGSLLYSGLGNIGGLISGPGINQHAVSHPGTAGLQASRFSEFTYPFPPGSILIMYSDGLQSTWGLDRFPYLPSHHASIMAGVLYRELTRGKDDVTVTVLRTR